MHGYDVYTLEVDDIGIDLIAINTKSKFFKIQGKSPEAEKSLYLINSQEWLNQNELMRNREYIGLKSDPPWGINYSKKNLHILQKYFFREIIETLK